jgi:hypothetical protein
MITEILYYSALDLINISQLKVEAWVYQTVWDWPNLFVIAGVPK